MATVPKFPAGLNGLILVSLCGFTGCNPLLDNAAELPALPDVASVGTTSIPQDLDEALRGCFERELNLEDHAAWQILHGALAFGKRFRVQRHPGGESLSAVEHLLSGGRMAGWTVEAGIELDPVTGRRGLRALVEPGSKSGQGHYDQWFAVLAQCGLDPNQVIRSHENTFTMAEFVAQVQWDVPRNLDREFSWTLIGLTSYLPTNATWVASDGQQWGIERLMQAELEQELAMSACGGTHRLIGMAMALNQHLAAGGQLTGVWQEADERIQNAIAAAKNLQNADGSFSSNYFERPGQSADLAQDLGTTGHVLEFLAIASTEDQLREPWIERAVVHLCDVFRKTRDVPLECGALYHAAHGLALYRDRVAG